MIFEQKTFDVLTVNLGEFYNNSRVIVIKNLNSGYRLEALDHIPYIRIEDINTIHKELASNHGITGTGIVTINVLI